MHHLIATSLALGLATALPCQDPLRPHVVVVLADDLGAGDLGCYNPDSKTATPHLDRVAAAGMRFTDMHSPSAVCTPTRYGLLTGRYAWRTRLKRGVLFGYGTALIEPDRATLARSLAAAGYTTGGFGKWHLGLGSGDKAHYPDNLRPGPLEAGFERYFGIPSSLDIPPYVWLDDGGLEAPPTATVAGSKHRRQNGGGFWRKGQASEGFDFDGVLDRIVDEACGWIRTRREDAPDQPIFAYVPLSAPHTPWLPTEPFRGKSQAGHYGDFVMQVDTAIGRLLTTLDELGMTEDTLVLITSDNGSHWPVGDVKKFDHRANLHFRGQKADIHEGGHRVPFLARWPGVVEPGSTCDQLLGLVDVYATVMAALEQRLPEGAAPDSRSFLPLLEGAQTLVPVRDHLVHHSVDGMFAIRQGPWKLIEGRGSGGFTAPRRVADLAEGEPAGQLYNLDEDPSETQNLYATNPERVATLQALLEEIRRQDH